MNTELAGLADRVEQTHGAEFEEYEGWSMQAMTWNDVSSQFFRTGVFVLLGAVTFVLLLVCANTANLLLARAATQGRDFALRSSLGASWSQLVRRSLSESLVLGVLERDAVERDVERTPRQAVDLRAAG